jgi:hypothetical protein
MRKASELVNDDLKNLIKGTYPGGTTDCLDDAALKNEAREVRILSTLQAVAAECGLNWNNEATRGRLAYEFQFTEKLHPTFEQWIWRMNDVEKISWIQKNGRSYPVLWLKISRIADYYYHFFNHWTPRGDTGCLPDFKQLPNPAWTGRLASIKKRLEEAGFKYLTDELAAETTTIVLERDYDSIPDDDPRWDDDDFEPPWVPSTVHECIFSD